MDNYGDSGGVEVKTITLDQLSMKLIGSQAKKATLSIY